MKDIRELMGVDVVAYDDGGLKAGLLSTAMISSITKGWLDPQKISGITSGGCAFSLGRMTMSEELCPPGLRSAGMIAKGEKFTVLHCPERDVLVVGTPDELYEKVADKLAELEQNRLLP